VPQRLWPLYAGGLVFRPQITRTSRAPRRRTRLAFGFYLSTTGLTVLAAVPAHDRFGLGPERRGLVVAAFGVAGLATGARLGRVADRIGLHRFGVTVGLAFAAVIAVAGPGLAVSSGPPWPR
jgi:nitrate/nitrite transporter NarK